MPFGGNPFVQEFSSKFSIPFDATRGGAETMYPEFMDKMKSMPKPQPKPAK